MAFWFRIWAMDLKTVKNVKSSTNYAETTVQKISEDTFSVWFSWQFASDKNDFIQAAIFLTIQQFKISSRVKKRPVSESIFIL